MKTSSILRAAAIAAGLTLASTAFAAPVTGLTTLGDVTQASTLGSINLGGPAYLLGTASTAFEDDAPLPAGALNLSGTAAADIADLSVALGVAGSAFNDEDNGLFAYEGSALFTTLNVQAGDTLSLSWRLLGRPDNGPLPTFDAAWLLVGQNAIRLGDTATATVGQDGWLDTGLQQLSYSFSQAGLVRIGLVVADIGSFDGTSVLAVQNLAVTAAVPEPGSTVLALSALGVLAGLRARRRSVAPC
ncbi:MAG: PEP-CTERM sorting domain-containing protein [Aquabacterium sp.]